MKVIPKCVNCDCKADRYLLGSWICNKCYPKDKLISDEWQKRIRRERRK